MINAVIGVPTYVEGTAMHRNAPALTPNQRAVIWALATAITLLLIIALGALG
ncbi:hypothetical protein AB8O38_10055 [Saccharomonospora xinjiangensis]|uniref:hypothetical protein n=1 Tax=Saccharomonospora xinjiangensis TaxID=75294 RepID=UPI003510699D